MSKYSADIEIAVRGGQQLDRTIKTLNRLNNSINVVTRNAKLLEGKGFNVASIENYSRAVSKAERAVRKAAEGTNQERQAITALVSAMELENKARERKNILIAREIANQRRVIATANAGVGMQGPAIPAFMRTGPSSPIRGSRAISGSPAALAARATAGRGGGSKVGGAVSSAIIGGGFPLLFGQGPGAAAGGALGGLAGGLLGGGFGFALSIAGTAIGDLITKSEALDKSLASLNSSLSSTGSTSVTTAADVSRLASNLRITNEEAIELLGTFSQFGDANIREAVASLFGGIGGASTFEAIARAGIDEKNALSSVFQLRQLIGNEAATQLALQLNTVGATQTQAALLKLVVERSIQSSVAASKQVQFTDNLLSIWENIVAGVATALSLATQFIKKMQEGQLIQLPFLDQVIQILGGGTKARTGKQIADERGAVLEKTLRDQIKAVRDAVKQETGVLSTQAMSAEAFKPQKKDRAAEEAERLAKQIAQQLKSAQDLRFEQQNRLTLLRAENNFTKAFTGFSIQRLEIERRYNELLKQSKSDEEATVLQQARTAEYKQSSLALQQQINELLKQAQAPLDDAVESLKNQAAFEREYGELIKNGTNPELAKQLIAIRKAYDESVKLLEPALAAAQAAVTKAEAEGASATEIQKYREELEKIEAIRKGLEGKKNEGEAAAIELNKPKTEGQKIEDRIGKLKDEMKELTSLSYQVTQAAEAIGSAFQQAFMGLVSGAMTGQQALAAFFQGVGDHFLDMASKMIAKLIEIWILQTVLGFIGGAAGGGGGLGQKAQGLKFNPKAFSMPKLAAEGAYWPGGFSAFADGGVVTKPTMGLVGEGGEPEYIIPASKMSAAMKRYGGGARGSAVIPTSGDASEAGGNAAPVNGAIDVRYTVERINSVDYVTADQFQRGMQQAAMQGAQRGEQQALRQLQQNTAVRGRVGLR